ncbi:MAG TPA: MFS transporter, partial [Acidimicrobiia bacterium]|nr:MFS transporter [Acidimicrobiia bacterium]
MNRSHSSRRWWTLCVLSLCVVVIGIDNTVLNVALPTIVRNLGATGSDLQWIVDAYTIVFACLLLTAGSLGDRYGRKYALRFGLIWFGFFSAFASVAASPDMLIATRALMGLGAAFIYPTTLSIITNTFTIPHERARAIGVWAGVAGVGIALGPLLGGVLVEHFGWTSVFLINVPICTIAVVLGHWFVPNSSSREESPLDP